MRLTRSEKIYLAICYTVVITVALLCLYPLLYTFFVSVCTEKEWVDKNGLLLFFPQSPTLTAYVKVLGSGGIVLNATKMSVLRAAVGTLLSLFFNVCTGYAMSRKDLPGQKQIMYVLLFTILFSGGLIPGYMVVNQLGLRNTFWALVIPSILNAWNVLIFKQFFEGIPKELEEAAEIDGAGEFKLMYKIIMPMSKPVIAAIGLFTMVGHWNSWFDVMLYIDSDHSYLWPLQYFTMINFNNLAQINANPDKFPVLPTGAGVMQVSQKMALTIVTMLPILLIYPFFQKYFTNGVYTGAVKG